MTRDQLTNEILKKNFASDFELANYAIKVAKFTVLSGQEFNLSDFLDEVRKYPHKYSDEEIDMLLQEETEENKEFEEKAGA
jgi:hypothetical protein